jgi:mRNA interferase MazF
MAKSVSKTYVKGDIVVLPFPFSDMSASKRRPALVLSEMGGDDVILCQITSQSTRDPEAVGLDNSHLLTGSLTTASYIRPNRLFTAHKSLIVYPLGSISPDKYKEVTDAIARLIEK